MYTFKNNSFEDNNIVERIESSNKNKPFKEQKLTSPK